MNDTTTPAASTRAGHLLERIERLYLQILRAAVLVIATLVLLWALWLAGSALLRIARSPDSVVEQPAVVAAQDLGEAVPTPASMARANDAKPATATPAQQQFYVGFVDRYYRLYRTRFQSFRQPEDKQLSKDEFDDNFVQSAERMQGLARGTIDFAKDQADLTKLVDTMEAAAVLPRTVERLNAYKAARKRRVERQVQRTRTERRRGWDSMSTACYNWYESPIGCAVTRTFEVPYTTTVVTMALPEGTVSHTQIFRAMHDRYFELLDQRRTAAARTAADERQSILIGQEAGWMSLSQMLWVLGGFLVLMFFFLLIAIERHQRRLVAAAD